MPRRVRPKLPRERSSFPINDKAAINCVPYRYLLAMYGGLSGNDSYVKGKEPSKGTVRLIKDITLRETGRYPQDCERMGTLKGRNRQILINKPVTL